MLRLDAIELQGASLRLGTQWALRDVTFRVRRGERWLLQGSNGAGKTVLLKLLRGDLWPTPTRTGRETRRYGFANGEVDSQPLRAFERVAYVGPERQDRYERYESTLTVAQVVLTGYDDSDFPLQPATAAQRRRIAALLQAVGLDGVGQRTLSYGQRRRALLARALVRRPDVLLLDEALNGLDARGRAAFLRALRAAVPARTAWVLTSHRRGDVPADVTHVARIEAGRLRVAAGPATHEYVAAGDARHPGRRAGARSQERRKPIRCSQLVDATPSVTGEGVHETTKQVDECGGAG